VVALFLLPLAVDGASDPISWLLNFGAVGVVLILVLTGQLRTKSEVTDRDKQILEKDEKIAKQDAALVALVQQLTSFMPELIKVGEIVEALPKASEPQLVGLLQDISVRLNEIQGKAG
jgi:hypothetical protein